MQEIIYSFLPSRLRSLSVLGLGATLLVPSLSAEAFSFGDKDGVYGSFDTTISAGAAWRTQNAKSSLIGTANGGTGPSANGDDGDLNFHKGDLISSAVKATHDLDLHFQNFGFFGRASYFYDFTNANKNFYTTPDRNQAAINDELRGKAGYDFQILDFYFRGDFKPADKNLQVRVGKQALNWGESTFIGNSISVINPISLPKLRVPGSELKEALLPTPMVWGSLQVTDNVSVEAFALTQFKKTILDPRGSFFSTTDTLSDGGNFLYAGGLSGKPDQHQFPATPFASAGNGAFGAPRIADREASDHGEFGFAGHWLAPQLNDTEFGFFAANYHSRTPMLSTVRGNATAPGGFLAPGTCTNFNAAGIFPLGLYEATGNAAYLNAAISTACSSPTAPQASYFADYPENIHLFGASFNTTGPFGLALQGEYSYRPNMPVQLSTYDLVDAAAGLSNFITGGNPNKAIATTATKDVPLGSIIQGYDRMPMHQLQVSFTKAFGPTLHAEQFTVLGEVGFTHLDLPSGRYYAAPGPAGVAPGGCVASVCGPTIGTFATENSWGYRLRASLDYPNLIGAVKVSPSLAYSSDVQGYGPTFNNGFKSASAGVTFTYREQWRADLTYVNNFGNPYNALVDRDFVSLNASYSF